MAEAKNPDAIALLKADHRVVEELFEKFETAKGADRKQKLANQICMELTIHMELEETIFYPACEGKIEEKLLKEGYVEHDTGKVLIAEIEAGGPDEGFYDTKVHVLSEIIEHHVEEEEKRGEGMFAQARKADLDLQAIGDQMAARKEELTAEYKKRGLPLPETTTFNQAKVA